LKIGIVSGWFGRQMGLEELVRWASEHKFETIQIDRLTSETYRICTDYNMEICAANAGAEVMVPDPAEREAAISTVKKDIEDAAEKGVRNLRIWTLRLPGISLEENLKIFQETFMPLTEHAEKHNVKLVTENFPARGRNLASTPEMFRKLFELVPSSFGLCMDPSHLIRLFSDPIRATREFGERIYLVHAKDTEILEDGLYEYGILGRGMGGLQGQASGWWRYRLPGYGQINWSAFFSALAEIGYDGAICIEHEDPLWGWRHDIERGKKGFILAHKFLSNFIV